MIYVLQWCDNSNYEMWYQIIRTSNMRRYLNIDPLINNQIDLWFWENILHSEINIELSDRKINDVRILNQLPSN